MVGLLGLNIVRNNDKGTVTLLQSGLMYNILESTNMED